MSPPIFGRNSTIPFPHQFSCLLQRVGSSSRDIEPGEEDGRKTQSDAHPGNSLQGPKRMNGSHLSPSSAGSTSVLDRLGPAIIATPAEVSGSHANQGSDTNSNLYALLLSSKDNTITNDSGKSPVGRPINCLRGLPPGRLFNQIFSVVFVINSSGSLFVSYTQQFFSAQNCIHS